MTADIDKAAADHGHLRNPIEQAEFAQRVGQVDIVPIRRMLSMGSARDAKPAIAKLRGDRIRPGGVSGGNQR